VGAITTLIDIRIGRKRFEFNVITCKQAPGLTGTAGSLTALKIQWSLKDSDALGGESTDVCRLPDSRAPPQSSLFG
jgi:hypothetical protein